MDRLTRVAGVAGINATAAAIRVLSPGKYRSLREA
jgi:hypothetical protein